jgi:type IV secretion system protein VirB9
MKKTLLSAALTLAFPLLVQAGNPGDDFHELYFSHDNPVLTPQEKEGVKIGRQWQAASATGIKPVMGDNGAVQFLFGDSQPSIVCAVMQVCDVELQAGEQVNGVHLGDSVRWQVEPSITGYGVSEVQHLIIKPRDVGLDTSLVATTNRRTYHFRLRSHKTEFMPRVSFVYPEDAQAKWDAIREREVKERERDTIPETREYLGNLDFNYNIDGDGPWKPVRVYNDGTKTVIEMPSTMRQTEAPTLLVLRGKNSVMPWGSKAEEVLVNYRVQNDRYIVDSVFDKAILIAGVGSDQEKVTIERGGK